MTAAPLSAMLISMKRLAHVSLLAALLAFGVSTMARAQEASETPPAEGPTPLKVVVVVAGDPDDALRAEAARVEELVEGSSGLITPGDPGLRQALRGETPADENDGLERARAERRRLGWDEEADGRGLLAIGRMSGARLLLVLRRREVATLEIFDVEARAFYEGGLSLAGANDAAVLAYVESRASATRRRSAAPPSPEVAAAAGAEAPLDAEASTTGDAPAESERWIKRGWPYIVAGILLAGVIAGVVVSQTNEDDTLPPVLRFRPGGG